MLNSKVFCMMMVVVGAAAAPVAQPSGSKAVDWTKDDAWNNVDWTSGNPGVGPEVVDSEEVIGEDEPEMHILPFNKPIGDGVVYPIPTRPIKTIRDDPVYPIPTRPIKTIGDGVVYPIPTRPIKTIGDGVVYPIPTRPIKTIGDGVVYPIPTRPIKTIRDDPVYPIPTRPIETIGNVPVYPIATPSYVVPETYYSSVPAGHHVEFPTGWWSGVPRPTGTGWFPQPTGWYPQPTGYSSSYIEDEPSSTSEYPTATASTEPTTVPSSPANKGQTVVYIGQRKGKKEHKLDEVCADPNVDIAILSFLHIIKGSNSLPASDMFALCTEKVEGSDLATCAGWEDVINTCQQNGKKVLLSIGGATMKESFDDPVEGPKEFAQQVWDLYGEGTGLDKFRPYGKAVLDGFDMDIENHHPDGWVNFAKEMKAHFKTGTKDYLLTAAPQCPRPDASLLDAVYEVDHLYIQFYNNEECGKENIPKSFGEWSKDILAKSPNTKLFVGLPGAEESAIAGYYMNEEKLGFVEQLKSDPGYGGLMTWDYVDAVDNEDGDFVEVLRSLA